MNFRTGGQTGVDRAVLDECLRRDLAVGGWCRISGLRRMAGLRIDIPYRHSKRLGIRREPRPSTFVIVTQPSSYILDRLAVGPVHLGMLSKIKKTQYELEFDPEDFESSVGNVIDF